MELLEVIAQCSSLAGQSCQAIGFVVLFKELLLNHKVDWNEIVERTSHELWDEIRPWFNEAKPWLDEVERDWPHHSLSFVIGEFEPRWEAFVQVLFVRFGLTEEKAKERASQVKRTVIETLVEARRRGELTSEDYDRLASDTCYRALSDMVSSGGAKHFGCRYDGRGFAINLDVNVAFFARRRRLVKIGLAFSLAGIALQMASTMLALARLA